MIDLLSTPCFQLVYSNSEPDDRGEEHFPDYASAAEDAQESHQRASTWGPISGEIPTPRQLHTTCVTISCDRCGYIIDEDDAMTYHFLPGEVAGAIEGWEWTIHGDQTLCPKCATADLPRSSAAPSTVP